ITIPLPTISRFSLCPLRNSAGRTPGNGCRNSQAKGAISFWSLLPLMWAAPAVAGPAEGAICRLPRPGSAEKYLNRAGAQAEGQAAVPEFRSGCCVGDKRPVRQDCPGGVKLLLPDAAQAGRKDVNFSRPWRETSL